MFSKALFKQSCKANGAMWSIITAATCFMLACVMLISGNGNIGAVKNSIQDTIIVKEVDAQLQKRALTYYNNASDGLNKFDRLFTENATDTLSYLKWLGNMPSQNDFSDMNTYSAAVSAWQAAKPQMQTEAGNNFASAVTGWQNDMPQSSAFESVSEYASAVSAWQSASPATSENAIIYAYTAAVSDLQVYVNGKAAELGYAEDSTEAKEMLGSVMYALNPNGTFNDFYTENGEDAPEDYDITSLIVHISSGDIDEYLASLERTEYVIDRASENSAIFIAGNMTKDENVNAVLEALSSYGVDKAKEARSFPPSSDLPRSTTSIMQR